MTSSPRPSLARREDFKLENFDSEGDVEVAVLSMLFCVVVNDCDCRVKVMSRLWVGVRARVRVRG